MDSRTVNQRLVALSALAGWEACLENPPLVIASVTAALRYTLSPGVFEYPVWEGDSPTRVRVGQRINSTERLLAGWVNLGYRHEPVVEDPGCFSLRGGIIDVFPPHASMPYRLELWDDEVDTIRCFDPYTQRSITNPNGASSPAQVEIMPAREQLPGLADRPSVEQRVAEMDFSHCTAWTRERFEDELVELFSAPNIETLSFYNGLLNRHNLLDYLPADGLLVLDRENQIETEAQDLEEKFFRMRESRGARGELPANFPSPYLSWQQLAGRLEEHPRKAFLESWLANDSDTSFITPPSYLGQLGQFTDEVSAGLSRGEIVVAVSQHALRLSEVLGEAGVPSSLSDTGAPPSPGHVNLVTGFLTEGWSTGSNENHPPVTLLTDAELFGTVKERRYRPTRSREHLGEDIVLSDLIPGSYVVHVDHGVARFAGTTHMEDDSEDKEFLVLEYAENDKLYVPTDHLDRVSAYVGAQDHPPTLTRSEYCGVVQNQGKSVQGSHQARLAEELLKAATQPAETAQGHEFGPGHRRGSKELEDSFPFEGDPGPSPGN